MPNTVESSGFGALANLLKRFLTWSGGVIVFIYAAGFVVVSIYLLSLGVPELNLASARYIAVGTLFWVFFLFPFIPACLGMWAILLPVEMIQQSARHKLHIYGFGFILLFLLFRILLFICCLSFCLGGIDADMTIFIMGSASDKPPATYLEVSHHAYWKSVWELKDWFAAPLFIGVSSGFLVAGYTEVYRKGTRLLSKLASQVGF